MLFRFLAVTTCLAVATSACRMATAAEPATHSAMSGVILDPGEGDFMAFCDAPELNVTVKFGVRQNSNAMTVGTARLVAGKSNFGEHSADEIIYFLSGTGFGTVGENRAKVHPGSSMFVPRGVRHGFENTGSEPMEFLWMQSPAGFEERLRSDAVPSLNECKRG